MGDIFNKINKYIDTDIDGDYLFNIFRSVNVTEETNQNNKIIHRTITTSYEEWCEYDEKGNVIHYKDTVGNEEWYKYDENNNKIYEKYENGYEQWFDSQGRIIHRKWENGFEQWIEFNEDGRWCRRDSKGNIEYYSANGVYVGNTNIKSY